MKHNIKKAGSVLLTLILCCSFLTFADQTVSGVVFENNMNVEREGEGNCVVSYNNDRVIVAMGDSYSSGEGIEGFYGDSLPLDERVNNEDWLCHRSRWAWSGQLTLPSSSGDTILMKEHRAKNGKTGNWYFVAMSGAKTVNILDNTPNPDIKNKEQEKRFKKYYKVFDFEDLAEIDMKYVLGTTHLSGAMEIEPQINVFDKVTINNQKAEYVTLTMGGNDIGFSSIITTAIFNCNYLQKAPSSSEIIIGALLGETPAGTAARTDVLAKALYSNSSLSLKKKMKIVEKEVIPETIPKLRASYEMIRSKAGDQAHILVAGYPHIISTNAEYNSAVFRVDDAETINHTIDKFNGEIKAVVADLHDHEGMNIEYCDVTEAFGNNGAYASSSKSGELINRLMSHQDQDLSDPSPIHWDLPALFSAYSIHPNKDGAKVYADCMQKKINYYEKRFTLTGNVTDSDTNPNPLADATVTVASIDGKQSSKTVTSEGGKYLMIPDWAVEYGQKYRITFEKEGYEPFTVYQTADKKNGINITIDAKLVPKWFHVTIGGTVADEKGNPVEGAEVTITGGYKRTKDPHWEYWKTDRTQPDTQTVYTDQNGQYTAEFVHDKTDEYSMVAKKDTYDTYTHTITVEAEKKTDYTFADRKITHDITLGTGMYKAYCEVVRKLEDKYGEGRIVSENQYLAGVAVVRLVDFDGDGKNELFCAYGGDTYGTGFAFANTQEVYRYEDGKAVSIYKDDTNAEGGVGPYVEYLVTKEKTYLLTDAVTDGADLGSWRVFDGSKNEVCFSYKWYENDGKDVFTIDGKAATESQYTSKRKAFTEAGQTVKMILYPMLRDESTLYYQGGSTVLEETQKVLEVIGYHNDAAWKKAYIEYLGTLPSISGRSNAVSYGLIHMDNDEIPELWITFGDEASGGVLCTYYEGKAVEMRISTYGFSYLEKENLFATTFMKQGFVSHAVYTIRDGEFVMLHSGSYCEEPSMHYPYTWDDTVLESREEYENHLNAAFDFHKSTNSSDKGKKLKNYEEVVQAINRYS